MSKNNQNSLDKQNKKNEEADFKAREETKLKEDVCAKCDGTGYIEIMGDGENFEWDVIGTKPCSECQNDD
jgi:hypothetical protein